VLTEGSLCGIVALIPVRYRILVWFAGREIQTRATASAWPQRRASMHMDSADAQILSQAVIN
jgi:hypothetical protein